MEEKIALKIDTSVDTKSAEAELTRFGDIIQLVLGRINTIITAVTKKVKGIAKLFNLNAVVKNLKEAMEAALDSTAVVRMAESLGAAAEMFIDKLDSIKTIAAEIASVMGGLFGIGGKTADASDKAAEGQTKLAKATAKAGQAAKGTLAAFDRLNVLEKKTIGGGGGTNKPEKPEKPEVDNPDWGLEGLDNLKKALEALRDALVPLKEELFAGLKWGYDNVLLPLAQWTMNEALPSFMYLLAGAAGLLSAGLDVLKPVAGWLWEEFLKPLAEWTGEMTITALDGVTGAFAALSAWIVDNQEKLNELWLMVEPFFAYVAEVVMGILESIKLYFAGWCDAFSIKLATMMDFWMAIITGDWQMAWESIKLIFETNKNLLLTGLGILWESMKNGFSNAWEVIKTVWTPVADWFAQTVMAPLQKSFGWLWDGVLLAADICLSAVQGVWEPLASWFYEKIAAPVSEIANGMWDNLKTLFDDGVSSVVDSLKGYVNNLLGLVESGANLVISIINWIIEALNTIQVDIPKWVPKYGGKSFGISIPTVGEVSIPRLATGAVIPPNAEFMAVLGDQRNGRNLEAPEGLIREIVREESGSREIVIRFDGSMAQLVRMLKPAIEQEERRQGARLIAGGY